MRRPELLHDEIQPPWVPLPYMITDHLRRNRSDQMSEWDKIGTKIQSKFRAVLNYTAAGKQDEAREPSALLFCEFEDECISSRHFLVRGQSDPGEMICVPAPGYELFFSCKVARASWACRINGSHESR
jgi:hypothetical protein